jgi:voltage-gated potassium channel Kch
VTGYSMSPWRILATSFVIIVVSALLYPLTGGLEEVVASGGGEQMAVTWEVQNPESASRYYIFSVFLKSLYFSVVTFTTLGYGDISPIGTYARTVAGIEALMGTALMALLVFVLSRRIQ